MVYDDTSGGGCGPPLCSHFMNSSCCEAVRKELTIFSGMLWVTRVYGVGVRFYSSSHRKRGTFKEQCFSV